MYQNTKTPGPDPLRNNDKVTRLVYGDSGTVTTITVEVITVYTRGWGRLVGESEESPVLSLSPTLGPGRTVRRQERPERVQVARLTQEGSSGSLECRRHRENTLDMVGGSRVVRSVPIN